MLTSVDADYFDSSALVKLVVDEAESPALKGFVMAGPPQVSCILARVELVRAVRHHGPEALHRARRVLSDTSLVALDDALLEVAGALDPGVLRSLDAIHLAAALSLGRSLRALVTYDHRMIAGAQVLGLTVVSPA